MSGQVKFVTESCLMGKVEPSGHNIKCSSMSRLTEAVPAALKISCDGNHTKAGGRDANIKGHKELL